VAAGSTAAGLGASFWVGPEPLPRLQSFYRKARPPGFWGPVAASLGEDGSFAARRLTRGLLAVVTASLSLFSLLTGAGSWLAGSPPPTWLPHRGPWIGGLLLLGCALVPLWWRLAFGPNPPAGSVRGRRPRTSK
jgi:hypothetical protein